MNNLITKNQLRFRPDDSTTNQPLYLLVEINQAFDSTKSFEVKTVFLISGNLLRLIQHYLSNRKQGVVLNGSYSDYSSIESWCLKALFLALLSKIKYLQMT